MPNNSFDRRFFLTTSAMAAGASIARHAAIAIEEKPRHKVERLGIGAIGMRYQGSVIADKARLYGDVVAIADVDRNVREQARASFGSTPRIFENYQELLQRSDIDVVLIATPDHWHAKMLVDAMRAGKDVYCEKPLTLTIDEGKRIRRVLAETGRIVQIGSWQRSDHRFRTAVELVRNGRIGELQQVDVVLGKNVVGGPFDVMPVPKSFNWNLWQGQTPDVPYRPERAHYTFRWWYEYSGGQMTDWGAHHVDIAQWAIGSLPVEVDTKATFPETAGGYNVAVDYEARCRYANGVVLTIADSGRNGILFTGSRGRIFVNRETLAGKAVDELHGEPLTAEQFTAYDFDNQSRPQRSGKLDAIVNHMGNFFDCVKARRQPISDAESQHRSASTCHLGNISMRLRRPLAWDPDKEEFNGDREANSQLRREQRAGFEVV